MMLACPLKSKNSSFFFKHTILSSRTNWLNSIQDMLLGELSASLHISSKDVVVTEHGYICTSFCTQSLPTLRSCLILQNVTKRIYRTRDCIIRLNCRQSRDDGGRAPGPSFGTENLQVIQDIRQCRRRQPTNMPTTSVEVSTAKT